MDQFPALDSERTLVLCFADPEMVKNNEAFTELRAAFPKAKMLGCSTSGETYMANLIDTGMVVAVMRFEKTQLRFAQAKVSLPEASYEAAKILAQTLDAPDLKGVLVFSDGLAINGSELVKGLRENLAESVIITGGLAGDRTRFESTWVLVDGQPSSHRVTAVGLYGEHIQIGFGSQGGWDIFGIERTVTRSKANVLYEIDQKPALELYKTYLGDLASGLPASALLFPLGLRTDQLASNHVVRTVLAVNEQEQSMTFAGDIPEGSLVRLMKANPERLIDGASKSAAMAVPKISPDQVLGIVVSCVGRRLVLGQRTEEELEACLEHLPAGSHQIGFYSYGEISPFQDGYCDLHNQTMTLTVLFES